MRAAFLILVAAFALTPANAQRKSGRLVRLDYFHRPFNFKPYRNNEMELFGR